MWYVFILPHRAPRPVKVRIRTAPFGRRPLVADLDRRNSLRLKIICIAIKNMLELITR